MQDRLFFSFSCVIKNSTTVFLFQSFILGLYPFLSLEHKNIYIRLVYLQKHFRAALKEPQESHSPPLCVCSLWFAGFLDRKGVCPVKLQLPIKSQKDGLCTVGSTGKARNLTDTETQKHSYTQVVSSVWK